MQEPQEHSRPLIARLVATGGVFLLLASAACAPLAEQRQRAESTLRLGAAQIDLDQLVQIFTIESLFKIGPDGRARPWMAESSTLSADGLSLVVTLRPNLKFHDDTPVTAAVVADVLRQRLPQDMGPAADDIASISATSDSQITIALKRPTSFLLESLEVSIRKPGSTDVGTGPFVPVHSGTVSKATDQVELRANPSYHQGRPSIDGLAISQYPSVRSVWADLLRDKVDMVYEVGTGALDSLQLASTVNVFSFPRNYQYVVFLNPRVPALSAPAVRRALNAAIDRPRFIQDGLNGHGVPSWSPVSPRNWAAKGDLLSAEFDPAEAARQVSATGARIRLRCLVAPDDERLALVVKRQLEAVGVEVILEEGTPKSNLAALQSGNYEGLLTTVISGPNMFRLYPWWHSKGPKNTGLSSPAVDAALDSIRGAITDDEYRQGVVQFQQAILQDPPAIFLAWPERARAVSTRFQVPAEPGVDMMGTLRLWHLAPESRVESN